jgi:hypothetical protein
MENLSSTLNPLTSSKLDHSLSSLQEGLSETANKGNFFDQRMLHQQSKHKIIEGIGDIACLQHRFPYPYSHFFPTRGLKSIQCWNQCLKYYSSSIFTWSQNHMIFPFVLEIFPHTRYGVSDVASLVLLLVQ